MGVEIERKWLVTKSLLGDLPKKGFAMYQFYLPKTEKSLAVRFRQSNTDFYCTIKEDINSLSRKEFEFPMPEQEFLALKDEYGLDAYVSKTRYIIDGMEVDVFHGKLEGLILAEKEFSSEEVAAEFKEPKFISSEVTYNKLYTNFQLAYNSDLVEHLLTLAPR